MRRKSCRIELVTIPQLNELTESVELEPQVNEQRLFITLKHDADVIKCLNVGSKFDEFRTYIDNQCVGFLAYLDYLFCLDQKLWKFTKGRLVSTKKESSRVVTYLSGLQISSYVCTHQFKLYPVTHTIIDDGLGKFIHMEDIRTEG